MSPQLWEITAREAIAAARAVLDRMEVPRFAINLFLGDDESGCLTTGFSHHICEHDLAELLGRAALSIQDRTAGIRDVTPPSRKDGE